MPKDITVGINGGEDAFCIRLTNDTLPNIDGTPLNPNKMILRYQVVYVCLLGNFSLTVHGKTWL